MGTEASEAFQVYVNLRREAKKEEPKELKIQLFFFKQGDSEWRR